ncbi:MAG: hypothetical protein J6Y98_01560 [Bacteroidales bacterium]|nr:hypothetical protein [Bacteroidales bacterium]MCR5192147.1 hypothetical protein [Bacteroidales bacterium]
MKSIFKFLTSGFGTDTSSGKAVGWTIVILLSILWLAIWIISLIVRGVKKHKANKAVQE